MTYYYVRGIPAEYGRSDAAELLSSSSGLGAPHATVTVHSLARDPYFSSKIPGQVATASLDYPPTGLEDNLEECVFPIPPE